MGTLDNIQSSVASDTNVWRRHANPWSVWTRLAAVPAFAIVVFARDVLGWWTLVLVVLLGIWMWLNVKVFSPVHDDERWESRAIFGEKFWLDRKSKNLPQHHLNWIMRLNVASMLMILPMAWGLWVLDPWATAFGSLGLVAGQIWALDRYSWLYADETRGMELNEKMQRVEGGAAG